MCTLILQPSVNIDQGRNLRHLKLKQNLKYTTIAIYTILVFAACLILYKVAFTWEDTMSFLQNVISTMSPFIMALLIAYFTSPMLNFFERNLFDKVHLKERYIKSTKIKRILSIVLSYLVILGTISILMSFVIPQVIDSVREISNTLKDIDTIVANAIAWLESRRLSFGAETYYLDFKIIQGYMSEYLPTTIEQVTTTVTGWVPDIINFTANIAAWLLNLILGFIIAIYLLFNKESYTSSSRKVFSAILPEDSIEGFYKTSKESHKIFTGFFIGKMIDSMIIGVLCFILMILLRIPYAVLISVIVGVTNMIPYFGPFIGGGIGILFLLIGSPVKALIFAVLVLVLQQFDGNILGPKILGDSTGLTPFWVIFAIMVFGSMFGIMGMFIGVPCFAVIKNIFDNLIDRRYRERMAKRRLEAGEKDRNYSL